MPAPQKLARLVAVLAAVLVASTGLAALLTSGPSPLATVERLFEAIAFRFFAPARPPSDRIVIVGITEETLEPFAYRSPIDRLFLAELIRKIVSERPLAIGLDVLIDRPSEPDKDDTLHQVIAGADVPVVMATMSPEAPLEAKQRAYLDRYLDGLKAGTANLVRDPVDDMIRDYVPSDPSGAPSLGAAIALATGTTPPDHRFRIPWRRTGTIQPPFAEYPAGLVPVLPPDWLKGKIVLIGSLIPGQDEHRTPISVFARPSYGIEIHAHALSRMLEPGTADDSPLWLRLGHVALAAAIGMALAAFLDAMALIASVAVLILATWVGVTALFALGGPLLLPLAPTLSLGIGAGAIGFGRARRGRQEHRILQDMFSRFVSEPVLREIWKDRSSFLAGGRPRPQKLVATVLFSDIAGFTPICEGMAPEPLVEWLDRYLEIMIAIVVAEHGVVLRFVGDGILAVFGAPVPRATEAEIDEDARNAVRCGLAMVQAMTRLNAEWRNAGLPTAAVRVGVHTGPLVAGSLGSGAHIEYCLLGDTANTGARLEALGKQYMISAEDSIVLVGSPTFDRLGGQFAATNVGAVSLKGKERQVTVYRVLEEAEVKETTLSPALTVAVDMGAAATAAKSSFP